MASVIHPSIHEKKELGTLNRQYFTTKFSFTSILKDPTAFWNELNPHPLKYNRKS